MRVCDNCRIIGKPVLDLRLTILKPDPDNARKSPEELQGMSLELCKECVALVWSDVESTTKEAMEVVLAK